MFSLWVVFERCCCKSHGKKGIRLFRRRCPFPHHVCTSDGEGRKKRGTCRGRSPQSRVASSGFFVLDDIGFVATVRVGVEVRGRVEDAGTSGSVAVCLYCMMHIMRFSKSEGTRGGVEVLSRCIEPSFLSPWFVACRLLSLLLLLAP